MNRLLLSFTLSLALIFVCQATAVNGQQIVQFEQGLALPGASDYQRSAIYRDLTAWQLATGQWEAPEVGAVAGELDEDYPLYWRQVEANEDGRFTGDELRSGYLYLTYDSDEEKVMWLNAYGHQMVFVNGAPRAGDMYQYDYLYLPVRIREGRNEFLLRTSRFSPRAGIFARLVEPKGDVSLIEDDLTLPHIPLPTGGQEPLWAGVRVVNSTSDFAGPFTAVTTLADREITTEIPSIPPMSVRKVPVQIDPTGVNDVGDADVQIRLRDGSQDIDRMSFTINALLSSEQHSNTFISDIDGSVQYYSVVPQAGDTEEPPAFVLTLHGAEVEAISQARAYEPKEWAFMIAPTNRRPRGFNWEDWGRLDALEVFNLARETYEHDPHRIYLTGHSMGGHGTWFMGATYPDYWAAIAPAAGYPVLSQYGSHDGTIPDEENPSAVVETLLRASNNSQVLELEENYAALGVYILHGDEDRVVPVDFARMMRERLGTFHPDYTYYEYPGGSHWYGNHSMDWPPLFDFFEQRRTPKPYEPDQISFITANPSVSSDLRWARVEQQIRSLEFSRFELERDTDERTIAGDTENISNLSLAPEPFSADDQISIRLDGTSLEVTVRDPTERIVLVRNGEVWSEGSLPEADAKGRHRHGPFKEAFQHRMVFVYGTAGTEEENEWAYNKARFDAESWYYLGNGSVDLVPDNTFDPDEYEDRGVILFGNRDTNSAWNTLLGDSPIQVERGAIETGDRRFEGDDLAIHFLYPRNDSRVASVGVVTGTGLPGMKATYPNPYFSGGSGFADFTIFRTDMLTDGEAGVVMTGFFDNNWSLDSGDYALGADRRANAGNHTCCVTPGQEMHPSEIADGWPLFCRGICQRY